MRIVDSIKDNNGELYKISPPIATDSVLGGIKAKAKTTESIEVAVDESGKLFINEVTIPEWANQSEKPTYTKSEIGLSDINKPISTATQTALNGKVDKISGKSLSTNDFTNDLKTKLDGIENNATRVIVDSAMDESSENPVQNKIIMDYVNSSISTNTSYFRGTFDSVSLLNQYSGEKTNNDYAFVKVTDTNGNRVYNRYKYNGTTWEFEYALNNSSFTAEQWATINSGFTSSDKTVLAGKAENSALTSHVNNADIHVTAANKSTWNAKYNKPSGGIPKIDLSSEVQDALNHTTEVWAFELEDGTTVTKNVREAS